MNHHRPILQYSNSHGPGGPRCRVRHGFVQKLSRSVCLYLAPTTTATTEEMAVMADDPIAAPPTTSGFWNQVESMVFGFLDDNNDINNNNNGDNDDVYDDPRLVLAQWENLWECDETDTKAESLTHFLEVWARITLTNDKGLTTPVSCTKFKPATATSAVTDASTTRGRRISRQNVKEEEFTTSNNNTSNKSKEPHSMKLIFRPPKRYLSYKEQKSMEKGILPDRKGAKVDAWSPGGVEITVTAKTIPTTSNININNASSTNENDNGQNATTHNNSNGKRMIIGVTARRCSIDKDTVIKKTTERAIVRRLEDALRIWKKNNARKQ